MIDLRNKDLPKAIMVNGKSFLIKTDFREWLKFGELIKNKDVKYKELAYIFEGKSPKFPYIEQLLDFYSNPNITPKNSRNNNDDLVNFILDGEYITAGFYQAYGIDLTSIPYMHWHLFKALFSGLPSNTFIKEIMSMRGYKKETKSYEKQQQELKEMWRLPSTNKQMDEELMNEINALFYNS